MNSLPNPFVLINAAKNYLLDENCVKFKNKEKLVKYQDNAIRKMVKYAYNVPMYKKKYRENRIHLNDIKGANDIKKLPCITKNDLKENFPNDIIPNGIDYKKFYKISSSGSTGVPITIFRDISSLIKEQIIGLRYLKFYGYNLKRDRFAIIGPHETPGRYDYAIADIINKNFQIFNFTKNFLFVGYFMRNIEERIKQMNKFNPSYLMGFPGDIKAIADYVTNGLVRFSPKYIFTSGENLDRDSKMYIEDVFGCKVYDIYSSIEMGAGAFQCEYGNYHIFSDSIYFEFLDEWNNPVISDKQGNIVITRLFGKGTPLIRYSGLGDVATPAYEKCPCGLETAIIKHIQGRERSQLVMPNGKYISKALIIGIISSSSNFDKIIQFQIVQEKIDRISIKIVFDKIKDNNIPEIKIISELYKKYQKLFGPEIEMNIENVTEITFKSGFHPPTIISRV